MDYMLHIVVLICIYAILSTSLNLISGYAGQVSLAHGAFYGLGAYAAALLVVKLSAPFLVGAVFAVLIAVTLGGLVGALAVRVRGDQLLVVTFCFQVIVVAVLNNWSGLTGGARGLYGIPYASVLGLTVASPAAFLPLALLVAGLVILCARLVSRSPFGRILKAISEDEVFTLSQGKNVAYHKVAVFALGSAMASLGGVLYAFYATYIDPGSFTFAESILVMSMVIIGGARTVAGPILGAVALVVLPEVLRLSGIPGAAAANVQQVFYGVLLVLFVLWRPQGLVGEGQPGSTGASP